MRKCLAIAGMIIVSWAASAGFARGADTRKNQGARRARRRHQGRLPAVRLPRSVRRKIIGFEPDLAADVAKRLGVKLELVPVVASNRIQFLQQGKIDLMIATMSDTPSGARSSTSSSRATTARAPTSSRRKSPASRRWDELKGKKVCLHPGRVLQQGTAGEVRRRRRRLPGHRGSVRRAQERQLHRLRVRRHGHRRRDAETGVERLTRCRSSRSSRAVGRRGAAQGEKGLGDILSKTITDWHKTGKLIALEKKWGIKPTGFAAGNAQTSTSKRSVPQRHDDAGAAPCKRSAAAHP